MKKILDRSPIDANQIPLSTQPINISHLLQEITDRFSIQLNSLNRQISLADTSEGTLQGVVGDEVLEFKTDKQQNDGPNHLSSDAPASRLRIGFPFRLTG